MKTKLLLFLCLSIWLAGNVYSQKASPDRGRTWYDFSEASSESKYEYFSEGEHVLVEGIWNREQFSGLRRSINESYQNDTLITIDMGNARFTGDMQESLEGFFKGCIMLESVILPDEVYNGEISLKETFTGCNKLTSIVNLGNLTNITDFAAAFLNCAELPGITLPSGNQGSTVSFENTFNGCYQLQAISNFDAFDQVSSYANTFNGCRFLETISIPTRRNADVVVDANGMFSGCESLTTIDNFVNIGNISSFTSTFKGCEELSEIALPIPTAVADSISFDSVFYQCESIWQVTNLERYETATSFEAAFTDCKYLQTITLPKITNLQERYSFSRTFAGCESLTEIENMEDFTGTLDLSYAFDGCANLRYVILASVSDDADLTTGTFTGCNLNCLKYLPEGSTMPQAWRRYGNFIIGNKAYGDIVLTDGYAFHCPKSFVLNEANRISYTRDFTGKFADGTNGWNAICLPFYANVVVDGVTKYPQMNENDPNGDFWLARQAEGVAITDEITLDYPSTSYLMPYTPYLIAFPGDEFGNKSMEGKRITFVAYGVEVNPEAPSGIPAGPIAFLTNYAINEIDMSSYQLFRGTGEEDYFAKTDAQPLMPFYSYLVNMYVESEPDKVKVSGIRSFSFPTGISAHKVQNLQMYTREGVLYINSDMPGHIDVYGIDGSLVRIIEAEAGETVVSDLLPGIYIVGGEKVVIGR